MPGEIMSGETAGDEGVVVESCMGPRLLELITEEERELACALAKPFRLPWQRLKAVVHVVEDLVFWRLFEHRLNSASRETRKSSWGYVARCTGLTVMSVRYRIEVIERASGPCVKGVKRAAEPAVQG